MTPRGSGGGRLPGAGASGSAVERVPRPAVPCCSTAEAGLQRAGVASPGLPAAVPCAPTPTKPNASTMQPSRPATWDWTLPQKLPCLFYAQTAIYTFASKGVERSHPSLLCSPFSILRGWIFVGIFQLRCCAVTSDTHVKQFQHLLHRINIRFLHTSTYIICSGSQRQHWLSEECLFV